MGVVPHHLVGFAALSWNRRIARGALLIAVGPSAGKRSQVNRRSFQGLSVAVGLHGWDIGGDVRYWNLSGGDET